MSLGSCDTNRSTRSKGIYLQMMGVWGWNALIFFIGYLAVSCLASHMEKEINTSLSKSPRPIFDQPVEFGGMLTAPGEFILAHAEALATGWLVIVMIAMFIWLTRKYKL